MEKNHLKVRGFQVSFAPSDVAGFSVANKQDEDGDGRETDEEMEKLISVSIKSVSKSWTLLQH